MSNHAATDQTRDAVDSLIPMLDAVNAMAGAAELRARSYEPLDLARSRNRRKGKQMSILKVPGARLNYQTDGSGPVLYRAKMRTQGLTWSFTDPVMLIEYDSSSSYRIP